MGRLVIPYRPRDIFQSYHASVCRFSLTIAHRRAGKTVARINKLIRKAIECDKPNPRFGYLAPYYVQAKDIAWLYLKYYSAPLLEMGGKANESELTITFPHNNAIIKLYGAENAERMRGLYFDGIVVDEGQDIKKSILTSIILPALADRQGWLDVSGTPKGWANLLGELYKLALANTKEWFVQLLKASETGVLPQEELDRQKSLMSINEYEQEFECSFEAAIKGAVYAKWISQIREKGQITNVAHDSEYPVYTAWDLGYDDATAIVFYQIGVGEIFIIDYYESNLEDIKHYCEVLAGKEIVVDERDNDTGEVLNWHYGMELEEHKHRAAYSYHTHNAPHDAANKVMAAGGRSVLAQAAKFGVRMNVFPATSHQNNQEALRATLPRCWISGKLVDLVDSLVHYHYKWNEDLSTYSREPVHDFSSHACDAMELMARAWRENVVTTKDMAVQAQINKFHRLRAENKLDSGDPYRIKPMRKT